MFTVMTYPIAAPIPSTDTLSTGISIPNATANNDGLMSKTDKSTLDLLASTSNVAIPNASESTSGLVSTTAQSFAGTKTFADGIQIKSDRDARHAVKLTAVGDPGETISLKLPILLPAAGDGPSFMKCNSDGELSFSALGSSNIPLAQSSVGGDGLMSFSDKAKLDGITPADLLTVSGEQLIQGRKTFTSPVEVKNGSATVALSVAPTGGSSFNLTLPRTLPASGDEGVLVVTSQGDSRVSADYLKSAPVGTSQGKIENTTDMLRILDSSGQSAFEFNKLNRNLSIKSASSAGLTIAGAQGVEFLTGQAAITLKPPASVSNPYSLTLPLALPSSTEANYLRADASGNLTFQAADMVSSGSTSSSTSTEGLVTLASAQTITGAKTFTSGLSLQSASTSNATITMLAPAALTSSYSFTFPPSLPDASSGELYMRLSPSGTTSLTSLPAVSTSQAGLMSSADKSLLDSFPQTYVNVQTTQDVHALKNFHLGIALPSYNAGVEPATRKRVTLKSPLTLAMDYDLSLPDTLPAQTMAGYLRSSTAGALTFSSIPLATTTTEGLMSGDDKTKFDRLIGTDLVQRSVQFSYDLAYAFGIDLVAGIVSSNPVVFIRVGDVVFMEGSIRFILTPTSDGMFQIGIKIPSDLNTVMSGKSDSVFDLAHSLTNCHATVTTDISTTAATVTGIASGNVLRLAYKSTTLASTVNYIHYIGNLIFRASFPVRSVGQPMGSYTTYTSPKVSTIRASQNLNLYWSISGSAPGEGRNIRFSTYEYSIVWLFADDGTIRMARNPTWMIMLSGSTPANNASLVLTSNSVSAAKWTIDTEGRIFLTNNFQWQVTAFNNNFAVPEYVVLFNNSNTKWTTTGIPTSPGILGVVVYEIKTPSGRWLSVESSIPANGNRVVTSTSRRMIWTYNLATKTLSPTDNQGLFLNFENEGTYHASLNVFNVQFNVVPSTGRLVLVSDSATGLAHGNPYEGAVWDTTGFHQTHDVWRGSFDMFPQYTVWSITPL